MRPGWLNDALEVSGVEPVRMTDLLLGLRFPVAANGRDRFFYVSDEDDTIMVRSTPLLTGRE